MATTNGKYGKSKHRPTEGNISCIQQRQMDCRTYPYWKRCHSGKSVLVSFDMASVIEWKTPRRCRECLKKHIEVFCFAREAGKNEKGENLYEIFCPSECGHSQVGLWDGK